MQPSIEELPEAFFGAWCQLYNAVAFNYRQRVSQLLINSDSVLQPPLNRIRLYDVPALVSDIQTLAEHLEKPDDDVLLDAFTHLLQLQRVYKDTSRQIRRIPWSRTKTPPEVWLCGQRFVLVSPVDGPIVHAVPDDQRVTPYSQIGNDRILDLTYRWEQIAADTLLDWGREPCLNAMVGQDIVRIAVSPFAEKTDMNWDPYDADRSPTDGAAPLRCMDAKDLDGLWSRLVTVLEQARKKKVHVLLLPELVVPDALLVRIKEWLSEHWDLKDAVLCLLVAGTRHYDTGSPAPAFHNRCTVLGAGGTVVWEQDKRERYHVSGDSVKNLQPAASATLYYEPTHGSRTIVIRQTALGLVVAPICLDFIKDPHWERLAADLYLIPAMSPGLNDFHTYARKLGRQGAASFVCNAKTDHDNSRHRRVAYIPRRHPPALRRLSPNLFVVKVPILT